MPRVGKVDVVRRRRFHEVASPMKPATYVVHAADRPAEDFGWGTLRWIAGSRQTPGVAQTFGVSTIGPGERNPLHYHPNCEEILYVVSGECDHAYDGEIAHLAAGDAIVIPAGVKHNLVNTGPTDVVCVISFSSPDRETVFLE
jgi:quercetin dioxygenase-like cupin family protein